MVSLRKRLEVHDRVVFVVVVVVFLFVSMSKKPSDFFLGNCLGEFSEELELEP